jgi:ribosomal protein S18 acetylase RimI-like enzyme
MLSYRLATPDDFEYLYTLHAQTMRTYIEQTWGKWDEAWQRDYFTRNFNPENRQIILWNGEAVGVLECVPSAEGGIFLSNIQISPQHQGQGIGRQVIEGVLAQGKPVRLQVFKVNPARHLYERLGFVIVGESDSHYQMRASVDSEV